ncbi:MAG TPA: DNA-binding protein, partial [Kutzneria sp.]|nr:DNA-binding protein [Kutzneria sp.]
AVEEDRAVRRRMRRSQTINTIGLVCTGAVLIVVLITKFLAGAWIAIAAMAAIFALMTAIRKHYDTVAAELRMAQSERDNAVMPSRNHAIVLISKLHLPTLRALSYAKATRPDILEAVTVNVDDADTRELVAEWDRQAFKTPLKVIESPYREITKPVLDYVKRVRTDNPRDVVTVFLPEYVVGHWWEQLLHNQSALRLKGRLLFQPGVMVTSVPWQLASANKRAEADRVVTPGQIRRGLDTPIERRKTRT